MIFCGERCRLRPATPGATGGLPASANCPGSDDDADGCDICPGFDDNVDTDNDGDVTLKDFGGFQAAFGG